MKWTIAYFFLHDKNGINNNVLSLTVCKHLSSFGSGWDNKSGSSSLDSRPCRQRNERTSTVPWEIVLRFVYSLRNTSNADNYKTTMLHVNRRYAVIKLVGCCRREPLKLSYSNAFELFTFCVPSYTKNWKQLHINKTCSCIIRFNTIM